MTTARTLTALAALLVAPLLAAGPATAQAQARPPGYYVCSYYYPFTCPDGVQGYGNYPPPAGPGLVYGEIGPDYDLCYRGFYAYDRAGWHERWRRAHLRPSCDEPRRGRS